MMYHYLLLLRPTTVQKKSTKWEFLLSIMDNGKSPEKATEDFEPLSCVMRPSSTEGSFGALLSSNDSQTRCSMYSYFTKQGHSFPLKPANGNVWLKGDSEEWGNFYASRGGMISITKNRDYY